MNAFFVAFLLSSTAILTVVLGVLGAYWTISGILAVVNQSRPSNALAALVPHQSHASGD
ncbi:MAG: hypothetical protein WAM89_11055 [Terriglobales bacterium]